MREAPLDDIGLLDARGDLEPAAAAQAQLDLDEPRRLSSVFSADAGPAPATYHKRRQAAPRALRACMAPTTPDSLPHCSNSTPGLQLTPWFGQKLLFPGSW